MHALAANYFADAKECFGRCKLNDGTRAHVPGSLGVGLSTFPT